MKEIWKPIKDFEGLYEVSNLGRVRTLERMVEHSCGKVQKVKAAIKKPQKKPSRAQTYLGVQLYRNSKYKGYQIHRLVAEAFIPNPENKPQVNHIDSNAQNNRVDNLEWVTSQENNDHAWESGAHDYRFRAVKRTDKDGSMKAFKSVTDGARSVGASYTMGVTTACKNGVPYKGFYWEYVETESATTIESTSKDGSE